MVFPKDDLLPLNKPEIIEKNEKAWDQIVGPYLSKLLGDKPWFHGDEFTALDIIVAFVIIAVDRRLPGKLEAFSNLVTFAEKVKNRPCLRPATQ